MKNNQIQVSTIEQLKALIEGRLDEMDLKREGGVYPAGKRVAFNEVLRAIEKLTGNAE